MAINILSAKAEYTCKQGCIERDGYTVSYSIEGQGKPIVILGSVIYYQQIFSQNLRKHAQLIFIDHRGFTSSKNPIDPEKITLDTIIEDFEYIRSQLGLEKFVLMGHSAHGLLSLQYAKKYPNFVESVVMIGISPNLSKENILLADEYFQYSVCPERKLVDQQCRALLPAQIEAQPDKKFIIMLIGLAARSWYDYTFDPTYLWNGVYANMPVIDRLWGKLFGEVDITQGLESFDKPVLLVLGKFDYLIAPFFVWNSIQKNFKDLTIQLFEHSGHTPCFEEPELFDKQLLDWIYKHCSDRT